ncbi:MAG: uroporphyrinogen decarboxylase family protein [Dehalococcoidales bacterium]
MPARKIISKETLNHRELIEMVSGLDVYEHTTEAFLRAYQALGIDIINRVPLENAPRPVPAGTTRSHPQNPRYELLPLGVYDTACCVDYPCTDADDVWKFDIENVKYSDLVVPPPHSCDANDIRMREAALGETGCYYPMLYTTLFMWPVELFGWEVFMTAAFDDPDRFFDRILYPCIFKSRRIIKAMVSGSTNPVIYVHDDLCDARGPVFPPAWYEEYIFPYYQTILELAKSAGRKTVLVIDGNITAFLPKFIELGFDGIMFENPATPLDTVLNVFNHPEHLLIGGIETVKLTSGTPEQIHEMVMTVYEKTAGRTGFAMSSCGGLHGNIPLENLEAYFDARAECGVNSTDWRTSYRH